MARPKKAASWSPSQAVFIVERALADRKLSATDIKRYVSSIAQEVRSLEERLASLTAAAIGSVRRVLNRGGEVPVPHVRTQARKRSRKAKRSVSAEVAASRRLQGQYIAAIRQIPKTKRALYKKISKAKGREEAIAAMKKARGK
jgi:hypothetical protein